MKNIFTFAVLFLVVGSAFADGRCVVTYNQATRALENRCEGNTHISPMLLKDETKALKEGRARECVIEARFDPISKKTTTSRTCR